MIILFYLNQYEKCDILFVVKKNLKQSSSLGVFSWQYQDFDSKILERNVAKIHYIKARDDGNERRKLIRQLIANLKENKIEYATYRIKASDFLTIHALEDEGFRLVDGCIKLETEILELRDKTPQNIRNAEEKDIPQLKRLASCVFSQTRFYNDPLIKKSQADTIYSEWIKNSILGNAADAVLIWEDENLPRGFITLGKDGTIILIAVDVKQQGKGIGKWLIKSASSQFKNFGVKSSTVETQMTNAQALRLYQACGYKIVDAYLTFRWSSI